MCRHLCVQAQARVYEESNVNFLFKTFKFFEFLHGEKHVCVGKLKLREKQ